MNPAWLGLGSLLRSGSRIFGDEGWERRAGARLLVSEELPRYAATASGWMCTELSQQCVLVVVATARYHPPLLVEVAEQEGSGPVKPGCELCMMWSRVFPEMRVSDSARSLQEKARWSEDLVVGQWGWRRIGPVC
jgi:hypothetical protein